MREVWVWVENRDYVTFNKCRRQTGLVLVWNEQQFKVGNAGYC